MTLKKQLEIPFILSFPTTNHTNSTDLRSEEARKDPLQVPLPAQLQSYKKHSSTAPKSV
jgi:hypothetical protein